MQKVCNIMDLLYTSNKIDLKINYKEFYNETANSNEEYKKVLINIRIGTNP